MISAATIAALAQRRLDYILGVRERGTKEVREVVMADNAERAAGDPHKRRADTDLRPRRSRSATAATLSATTWSRRRRPLRLAWGADHVALNCVRATSRWSATAPIGPT
jgi:hypothetical protein